jgi:UDP-N-acetylmuramoyl-tripeptide--D-alanyl-D-alanine ligase
MHAMMQLDQAIQWLSGAQLKGNGAVQVGRVHTDTRTVEPGDLFVALRGERFDANDFLLEARRRGAVAAICHASADLRGVDGMGLIVVPDTRIALGELARGWRSQFTLPLIAVTGSNGKTTVTQMLASILAAFCPDNGALATRGNLNNDIGVPLTVLRLRSHHRIAVVELGMNHPGEIAALASVAQPTVALVNNAQREHLEFMHTVQAVALENGSVISALDDDGVVVIPHDDAYTDTWRELAGCRRAVTFALDAQPGADALVCKHAHWNGGAWDVLAEGLGHKLSFRLAIAGRHNVKNALAAAAAALCAEVPQQAVIDGLQSFLPVKGRSRALLLTLGYREITLVDDTYNANPDSVRAAIDVLADLPGPRVLVLGDMGEVGHQGAQFHAEAGSYALAQRIDRLMTVGELAQCATNEFEGGQHFESADQLVDALLSVLPDAGSVLVKGSRFMRMERVVDAVMRRAASLSPQPERSHVG